MGWLRFAGLWPRRIGSQSSYATPMRRLLNTYDLDYYLGYYGSDHICLTREVVLPIRGALGSNRGNLVAADEASLEEQIDEHLQ